MATRSPRERVKRRPGLVTALLSVVGYVLVVGAVASGLPFLPRIGEGTVNLLSDSIALVNTAATLVLLVGWYRIRAGDVDGHRRAMTAAFGLILVFLVLYLLKTGGGGTKEIALAAGPTKTAYLAMLAVHVLLSMLSVPVVLYALVLGLTHAPAELRTETPHRRVGRVAATAWILSLTLGVFTYLLLNHVYGYEFVPA